MSWQRPHLAAPVRLSCTEAQREIRRAVRSGKTPTLRAIWRNVSAARMFDAPFILSASCAAYVLCVELKWVYRAIRDGALPAEKEQLEDGRFRWRILRSDVERLAGERA